MKSPKDSTQGDAGLPRIWEYTDYRRWLLDTYNARKAIHKWYSYGVLAQRAGFSTRAFLYRVMQGQRGLSEAGAEKLAQALDLPQREKEYFLALVVYNQAKRDSEREVAWSRVQHIVVRSRNASAPRLLTGVHRQIMAGWNHLAIRSLLEMKPDPGDWEALGRRLRPRRPASSVKRSIALLLKGGLIEKRDDGLWYATDKSLATPPEVALPAVNLFHRGCLRLAAASLENCSSKQRNITGMMLGISSKSYDLICERVDALHQEIIRIAESDCESDRVYQLTVALFPLANPAPRTGAPCE